MSSSSSSSDTSTSDDDLAKNESGSSSSDEHEEDLKLPALLQPAASRSLPPRPFPVRKGSRFPNASFSTRLAFDNKRTHYQYLHKKALRRAKKAREANRKLRETLQHDEVAKDYPTLQSSSSEDSDDLDDTAAANNSEWENETPDWQALAAQQAESTWWATNERLFHIMPVGEISSLVGWATHVEKDVVFASPSEAAKAMARNEATQNDNAAAAPPADADARDQVMLAGLPNTPLPPSHLRYLNSRARAYIEAPRGQLDDWQPQTFLTSIDDSSDEEERQPTKKRKRKEWQQWDYDSNDETYQSLLTGNEQRHEHVTMHIPRPRKGMAKPSAHTKKSHLYGSMDISALVALGMVWEDMVTALLLPLAQQHVARCRRLEQTKRPRTCSADSKTETHHDMNAFEEWTLPPEQAIWRLTRDEGVVVNNKSCGLLSTRPPTRVLHECCFDRQSSVKQVLVNLFGGRNEAEEEQDAVNNWCRVQNLDPAFVANNMDLFGICLSRAPTVTQRKAETAAEREGRNRLLQRILKKERAKKASATMSDETKDEQSTAYVESEGETASNQKQSSGMDEMEVVKV